MVNKGNHPKMAELFRLVNYYNLPMYIYIYTHMFIDMNGFIMGYYFGVLLNGILVV